MTKVVPHRTALAAVGRFRAALFVSLGLRLSEQRGCAHAVLPPRTCRAIAIRVQLLFTLR